MTTRTPRTYIFSVVHCNGNQEAELRARRMLRDAGERALDFRMTECGPLVIAGRASRDIYRVRFARLPQSER